VRGVGWVWTHGLWLGVQTPSLSRSPTECWHCAPPTPCRRSLLMPATHTHVTCHTHTSLATHTHGTWLLAKTHVTCHTHRRLALVARVAQMRGSCGSAGSSSSSLSVSLHHQAPPPASLYTITIYTSWAGGPECTAPSQLPASQLPASLHPHAANQTTNNCHSANKSACETIMHARMHSHRLDARTCIMHAGMQTHVLRISKNHTEIE